MRDDPVVTSQTARWSVAAVLALGLVGGCSDNVSGSAAPPPVASVPTSQAVAPSPTTEAPSAAAQPAADSCGVSIFGQSVRTSGGGRARAENGTFSFSCHDGPLVKVVAVGPTGARLTADGKTVLVAEGATKPVGPYQVTTVKVSGTNVEFTVAGPG